MFLLAKELGRSSNNSLALHVLQGALEMDNNNPILLNEIGVVFLKMQKLDFALSYCKQAAIQAANTASSNEYIIFNNYATCLRKSGYLEEALKWFSLCLRSRPGKQLSAVIMFYTVS